METFTLKRDGDRSLVFEGELIGRGSSRRGDAPRWFEVHIYRTAGGVFVIGGAGRSLLPGETDRCWAETAETGPEAVRLLTRKDDEGVEYLTRTARDALSQAAEADDRIRDAFLKRVA